MEKKVSHVNIFGELTSLNKCFMAVMDRLEEVGLVFDDELQPYLDQIARMTAHAAFMSIAPFAMAEAISRKDDKETRKVAKEIRTRTSDQIKFLQDMLDEFKMDT